MDGWSGIGRHIVNGSSSWAPVGVEEEVTTPPEALLRAPPRADDGEAGMAATGTAIMVKVRGDRVKESVRVAKMCLVELMRRSTEARADSTCPWSSGGKALENRPRICTADQAAELFATLGPHVNHRPGDAFATVIFRQEEGGSATT